LAGATAAGLSRPRAGPAAPPPEWAVRLRRPNPYEALARYIEPGHDEFTGEKPAAEVEQQLERMIETRALPLAAGFHGSSPLPARYKPVAGGVWEAEFDPADRDFASGLRRWIESLGRVRRAGFSVLPGGLVRYEVAGTGAAGLEYRVGWWKHAWQEGKLARFEPVSEALVRAPRPLFEDVTSSLFGNAPSFHQQLARGVPYWRARLDSAGGIDVYGNNGIAVGDIDGDGWDEVYVCQPGGLPNRLYRLGRDGSFEDVTERAGVAVLDDTASALFLDLRNSGRQDLIVATRNTLLLFLNQGDGAFRLLPDAFRFATPPQGTFTGIAAADYDRDGRIDLYVCSYVYYQSEDQYRYPIPYHDAQNGPPNFLFRNRLTAEGGGWLEDVTAAVGLDQNNNRYSFAPSWCDFDGDGWPDLYVANDFGRNNLYKNDHGRFRDVAAEAGVEDIGPGMSTAWFDYDSDGRLDLYVANMFSPAGQRVVAEKAFPHAADGALGEAYRRHAKGNSLYRNRGGGRFEETGAAEGVEMGRWAWSADGLDFDNDGTPEIYITCGMLTNTSEKDLRGFFWRQVVARSPATRAAAPAYENGWNALDQWIREDYSWNGREPNVLYARRGGRFYDYSGVSGLDFADDSRAFAATDLDGDGALDLLVKSRLGPQVRALRNRWGTARRSIVFQLRGTRSNRDAIGAQVELEQSGGRSVQSLQAGSGFLSQHTKRLHFGLGDDAAARRVRIRWPSGTVQEFENLEAGFLYEIAEGSGEYRRRPFAARPLPAAPAGPLVLENRPRLEPAWLLEPVRLPEERRGPGFLCLAPEPVSSPPGIPFEALDLSKSPPDVGAYYALFRRYLFDYRTGLSLPLVLLIDERGLVHKVYPQIPAAEALRADLERLRQPDRLKLALPFPGTYYAPVHRNHFRMAAAFYWAGYPEQSLLYFDETLRQNPENPRAHLAVGHVHLEAGRHAEAREHLERALALNPESGEAWNTLGGLEMALQKHREALRCFEKALAILPMSSYGLVGAGRAHARLGEGAAAEKFFRRALEVNPQDPEAANQLGLLLAAGNRRGEARQYFQQAIAAQRDHGGAINNLGVLYMEMNQPDDAVAAFRYGIEVAPGDETLYLNLARVYVRQGDRVKAREVLRLLQTHKPESAVARKALHELEAR
jgi:tetratricopeptide (TPR) repeat protein